MKKRSLVSITDFTKQEQLRILDIAEEFEKIRLAAIPASLVLESIDVPAKKTAITVEDVVLAWVPSTPAALQ